MAFLRRFTHKLINFLQPDRVESDLAREVQAHLDVLREEFQRRGMNADEASLAARRAYGGVEQAKELHREERSWLWLEQARQDIRFAIRALFNRPGFSIMAISTLALGVGVTTTIFSATAVVLLRSLPYPNSGQLVIVRDELSKMGVHFNDVTYETFEAYRRSPFFDSAAAFTEDDRTLIGSSSADSVSVLSSTSSLPDMLGVHTTLGRGFAAQDWKPDQTNVAILSYSLFASRFGARSAVIGQTLRLDDRLYKVIGVMAPTIKLGFNRKGADLWVPLPTLRDPLVWQFHMLARMRPAMDISQAQAAITETAKHVEAIVRPYRGPNGENGGYTARVISLRDQIYGEFRAGSILLTVASFFLLLIAYVNVANLLLARAAIREKETAMRRALGASGARLVRQWLTEAAVLTILGGGAGLVLGYWGVVLLRRLSPSELPISSSIGMDGRVVLYAIFASVIACAFLSVASAVAALGGNQTLRGPRRGHRLANGLITIEIAAAIVLLIGCGLLGKSLARLHQTDTGVRVDHLLTAEIHLAGARYKEPAQRIHFFSDLHDRLTALLGVVSASAVNMLPIFRVGVDTRNGNPFSLDDRPWNPGAQTRQMAHTITVGLDYFRTMGIGLLKGRSFARSDTASTPRVAIINHTLERMFFPDGNAVGKRILFGAPSAGNNPWMTIVGVVSDVRNGALDLPPPPQVFMPHMQDANGRMVLVIRTMADPIAMTRAVLNEVRAIDPEQPVSDVGTMQEHLDDTLGQPRVRAVLTSLFGFMALILAAVGIYGVVSNSVVQRTREFGVRAALGADSTRIALTILTDAMRPVGLGLSIGLLGGAMLARLLSSILYEVRAEDPTTLLFSVIAILFISSAACLSPALLAARIDPVIALREE